MFFKYIYRFIAVVAVAVTISCKQNSPNSPQVTGPAKLIFDSHWAEVSVDVTPGYAEERQYYRYKIEYHFENAGGFIEFIDYDLGDRRLGINRHFAPEFAVEAGKKDSLSQDAFGPVIHSQGSEVILHSEFHGFYIIKLDSSDEMQTQAFRLSIFDTVIVGQHIDKELPEENSRQITVGSRSNRFPSWSPDGSLIAYESRISSQDFDIWTITMNEGMAIQITASNASEQPSWSPDGTEIAFRSSQSGNFDIWKINLVDIKTCQLTNDRSIDSFPSWSPDGNSIAFASDRFGSGQSDIWIIPSEGGVPNQITTSTASDLNPCWSPDGSQIAFSSNRKDSWDIWTIPIQGGTPLQITSDPANELAPSWSPDGKKIAFQSDRNGNMDIWVVSTTDGALKQITTHSGDEGNPVWSPDSTWLAFDTHRRGSTQIWIIPVQP
ncbi:MAG: hypothetical protein ACE5JB_04290 [bacterium]